MQAVSDQSDSRSQNQATVVNMLRFNTVRWLFWFSVIEKYVSSQMRQVLSSDLFKRKEVYLSRLLVSTNQARVFH